MLTLPEFRPGVDDPARMVGFNTGSGTEFYLAEEPEEDRPPGDYCFCGSKSVEAFKQSVYALFRKHKKLYMWSLTFPDVPSLDEAARRWKNLRDELVKRFGIEGARVIEKHLTGHGLHYHALIPRWFPVRVLRRIAKRGGFGRIHLVEKLTSAAYYLSKHFSKTRRSPDLRGVRLWAAFGPMDKRTEARPALLGGGVRVRRSRSWHVRVRDLHVETREAEIFRTLRLLHCGPDGVRQLRRDEYRLLSGQASDLFTQEIVAGRRLVDTSAVNLTPGGVNLVFN